MVLGNNASSLVYATYFGGSQSQEHVDGGTSRFSPDGNISTKLYAQVAEAQTSLLLREHTQQTLEVATVI